LVKAICRHRSSGPGGDSPSFASQNDVTQATLRLPAGDVLARLKAAREWGLKLLRANGKSASVGYCFGGAQSFALAVNEPGLNAAVVYTVRRRCLVFTRTRCSTRASAPLAPTEAKMKELGKDLRAARLRWRRAWIPPRAVAEQR